MNFVFAPQYINRQDVEKLDPIRLQQFCAAAEAAIGINEPVRIFDTCEKEQLFWQYLQFIDENTDQCLYEGWFMGYISEGTFLADCGTIFYVDTVNQTGIIMVQHSYQAQTQDPQALQLLDSLEGVSFVFELT